MWNCIACGEQVDDDFEVCWNCQTSKDGKPSESFAFAPLPKELDVLRERLSRASDEDLLRIVNIDSKHYSEEGLILVKTELARRNLLETSEADLENLMKARAALVQPELPKIPKGKLCSYCKAVLEEDAKFCAECRTPVVKDSFLECPNCKKTLNAGAKFCKYCAAEIVPQSYTTLNSQRTKANTLAASGAILAVVSALAFWWGQSYTSSWANTARAGFGNLVGQQDATYQLAQYCIILGALGFIVGVVLFIVGLSQW